MSSLIHDILGLPGWLVLLIAGSVVFAEDALFIGFVLPGETAALLAGAAAKLGHVPLAAVLVVVVIAAIGGDTVGYAVGHYAGDQVMGLRMLQRRRSRLDDAREFLARRGGAAVFLGRWVAFLRAVVPALAGSSRMPYPRFLAWNASGGIVWGATVVILGYAAGASYAQAEKTLGRDVAVVVLAMVIAATAAWRIREHRKGRQPRARRTGTADSPSPRP